MRSSRPFLGRRMVEKAVVALVLMAAGCVVTVTGEETGRRPNDVTDSASISSGGKFGFVGDASNFLQLEEVQGFPSSEDFFKNYVYQSKPLVMRGAGRQSPAFERWRDDEYFLQLELPDDELMTVETMKKENRTQEILDLNFREFIQTYQEKDRYMVHRVPTFLEQDVVIPRPLQCPYIYENCIVESIMWFSGGGTKSVVHTDSVDNMNCVYVGDKHFVMINPKFADKVLFDHPEGAYSDIDVDNVDYDKYKALLNVDYYHVELEAGDCLFIPYKWIHQVRSGGPRNIAINLWWDTHRNQNVDFEECPAELDPDLKLDRVVYIGFKEVMQSTKAIRDQYEDHTRHGDLTLKKFIYFNVGAREMEMLGHVAGYQIPLKAIFNMIDKDDDGIMTHKEVKSVKDWVWKKVLREIDKFEAIMDAIHQRMEVGERDEL